MNYISNSVDETNKIGRVIAAQLRGGEVVCLYGTLGAGKSVLIRAVVHYFLPQTRVLSPTFIIVRHYQVANNTIRYLYHLDLYRVETITDIEHLGVLENFHQPDIIFFIEWAEKLKKYLPDKRMEIKIEILTDTKRKISVVSYG